jgi:glutamyl-tRNA synthetase
MLNFLATMGWSSGEDRKLYSREELIEKFTFEGIVNHPAVFDLGRLNDLQGEYIRMKSVDELADLVLPWLQKAGCVSGSPSDDELSYLRAVTALIQERLVLLKDAPNVVSYLYRDELEYEEKGVRKHLAKDTTPALFNAVIEKLQAVDGWTVDAIDAAIRDAGASVGMEGGAVIHPIRMAVTGRTWGPGLFELMEIIGKDRCLSRLRAVGRCEGVKVRRSEGSEAGEQHGTGAEV